MAGAGFAAALAYLLARRMTRPITLLEEGAKLIGAGQFDHKIDVHTGDELEGLAAEFNEMAGELALSQERSERIARLKRFLAPQIAELVEGAGKQSLLDSRRAVVAVVFCDLRGFTAFSGEVGPEEVIGLLGEYYEALGAIIMRYEATLTCFMGDGLMLLLNAPRTLSRSGDARGQHGARNARRRAGADRAMARAWPRHRIWSGRGDRRSDRRPHRL